jgi:hypothetical protein
MCCGSVYCGAVKTMKDIIIEIITKPPYIDMGGFLC